MAGSEMKTHKSAVVIIPPEEIWEPIQKIRHTVRNGDSV